MQFALSCSASLALVPTPHLAARAHMRFTSPQMVLEPDPGYRFLPRSEGAAAAISAERGQRLLEFPGIGNYITVDAVSNNYMGPPPASIVELAVRQFARNLNAIFGRYDEVIGPLPDNVKANRAKLRQLKLDTANILAREEARGGIPEDVPLIIRWPYVKLCEFIDIVFEDRPVIERFFFLETVARMPYFSYVSMLHLYETLGFWRRGAETKRVHGDEEYNEYHHLIIMESLGGDQSWKVRFLAQHAAVAYYWALVLLFMASPSLGYLFSVLLEGHAVDTYKEFTESNRQLLAALPAPKVARDYYNSIGYYLSVGGMVPGFARTAPIFGEEPRPNYGDTMETLLDVFEAIIKDEADHVLTMKASRGEPPTDEVRFGASKDEIR
jgi:ubiquinol oxidase